MAKVLSGDARIDGLLSTYSTPSPVLSWHSGNELGTPVNLSYSFLSGATNGVSGFSAMNANLQGSVSTALTQVQNFANVTFNQVGANSGDMNFGTANYGGSPAGFVAGVAYTSWGISSTHSSYANANVYLTNAGFANYSTAEPGSSAFATLLHEIGHGLGLDHSFSGGIVPDGTDSSKYTLMSYTDFYPNGVNPSSLMLYDIMAIQYLYGANTSYNSGNTTIDLAAFLANGPAALWDGGGTDTITLAGLTSGMTLNLTEGIYSSVNYTDDFVIAYNAGIENARGSDFADTITGNGDDNTLYGVSGNDVLNGGDGNDVLSGGSNNDTLYGQNDNDVVLGGAGTDSLYGGTGNDTLSAGSGNDNLDGGADNDIVLGGGGNDTVLGNTGFDTLAGGGGDDSLDGGAGNDLVLGASGSDTVRGGEGVDVLSGGTGDDFVFGDTGDDAAFGAAGSDTLYGGANDDALYGGVEADIVFGGGGNDSLFGGLGNDFLTGGVGNDTYYGGADSDVFEFTEGADQVSGYTVDEDSLRLSNALWGGASLSAADVLSTYATQTSPGIVTFDFGGGNTLRLVNGAGVELSSLADEIFIF